MLYISHMMVGTVASQVEGSISALSISLATAVERAFLAYIRGVCPVMVRR